MSGIPSPSPARINGGDRDKDSMWYFSSEELANSPSRKAGISPDQELSYRQMTAYLIQEMGQRLQVSQLCINTAIVYMHRFYAFHSFTHFHRNGIAAASLFLAAKVEEQPRKLEHVIKAANKCLNQPTTSTTDTYYLEQAQDLVFNENVLLQTLGFDVAIDHPHTHVVKTCQLVKACKDLAQTSYFLASNSLHLTSMCLQYKPSVVACFCIYLACKWSRWEIPQSTEGKHWFHYVDETVTMDLLKKLTDEFIAIYEKSPARLKSKLNSIKALAQGASNRQGQVKDKKADQDWKVSDMMNMKMYHPAETGVNTGSQSQSSSSQYSSQGSAAGEAMSQQQSGSISQPMLPPPPHQPQQMRKPDLHSSSQHRSHHSSSSSSSSHHPAKIGYSPGDVPDHKLSSGHSKQQQQSAQPYGGSNMVPSRPPREHTSSMMAPSSNKSSSSSSRSSMSNSLPGGPPLRQSSSQGHPMEVNYHKSRERNMAVPPPSSGHNMPPHVIPHKLPQKQDGSRSMSSKDHSGRLVADQANKQSNSNSSSNKMFPSSVSSQYGGNNLQLPPGNSSSSQLSSKLDTMHDITRNLMHTSRSGYNNPPPPPSATNGPAAPLLNFHQQQQQGSRHGSSNSSNNNNNSSLKHEQSKQQISVHMQQQSQNASHHHKQPQPLPADQSYGSLSGAHDLQQQSHVASSLISNNYSKIEPLHHSEEPPQHPANQYHQQQQAQHAPKAVNSLFSPEWNDKPQGQQQEQQIVQQVQPPPVPGGGLNNYMNSSGNLTQNPEAYAASGYKIPSSSISNKESSPPKIKSERDTPSKKEKNRSNSSNQDNGRSAVGHASTQQQQQIPKTTIPKKLDSSLSNSLTGLNELAGTSNMGTIGGIKRPNETVTIKQEDDLLMRDSKIRKIDTTAGNDNGKHQVVNGIETNPDLVRNLLKESLCSTPSIVTPSLQPPAELFEPSATTSSTSQHNTSITSISNNVLSGNSDVSAMETDDHGTSGSKSEKKKKKDKHKHKEKDKSKDREERKKHKKDKDRHKDKERDRDNNDNANSSAAGVAEHVKIKISKEKLEAAGEPIGFKIKIPKDRIMGDLNTGSSGQTNTDSAPSHAPPVLKIKISKDKLESYSSGSTDMGGGLAATTHPSYAHNQSMAYSSYGAAGSHSNLSTTTHSSSSSSKKKDRDREKDRERDKDKKRNHDSSSKSNGGGSSSLMTAGVVASNATNGSIAGQNHSNSNNSGSSTTQKAQYSSKIHHQSSMSLLFGESNESNDDDDDYNDDY
ncbi:cyclin-T isoform X2 [Lucilia sericata]|uniref:cyclin-T isoform X2 n=1 Tax=Lucilia sericata TaxID=13632 RepID=UPI0018A880BC|nr:cyclin-T isoform X2 [Lucilia sericata]